MAKEKRAENGSLFLFFVNGEKPLNYCMEQLWIFYIRCEKAYTSTGGE